MKKRPTRIAAKPSALDSAIIPAQRELFKAPKKRPATPIRGTKAWLAMRDMVELGTITQPDWLNLGRGWRLAAAVKELAYLGWTIVATWVQPEGYQSPIKSYRLPTTEYRYATRVLKGGAR